MIRPAVEAAFDFGRPARRPHSRPTAEIRKSAGIRKPAGIHIRQSRKSNSDSTSFAVFHAAPAPAAILPCSPPLSSPPSPSTPIPTARPPGPARPPDFRRVRRLQMAAALAWGRRLEPNPLARPGALLAVAAPCGTGRAVRPAVVRDIRSRPSRVRVDSDSLGGPESGREVRCGAGTKSRPSRGTVT
jgi:hypothetical protein